MHRVTYSCAQRYRVRGRTRVQIQAFGSKHTPLTICWVTVLGDSTWVECMLRCIFPRTCLPSCATLPHTQPPRLSQVQVYTCMALLSMQVHTDTHSKVDRACHPHPKETKGINRVKCHGRIMRPWFLKIISLFQKKPTHTSSSRSQMTSEHHSQ